MLWKLEEDYGEGLSPLVLGWDDRPSTHTSEPETARDAQSLERLCRSRGKHLKHSTKGFQTLQTESHNALSSGNNQEELETCTCLQDSDLIGITETSWSVGMEKYELFRRDRQGR